MKYSFIFILIMFVGCRNITNDDPKDSQTDLKVVSEDRDINKTTVERIVFSENTFLLKDQEIFKLSKTELIKKFNLSEDQNEPSFRYNYGINYFLIDKMGKVIYFEINDRSFIADKPNIQVGMSLLEIQKNFPQEYQDLSQDFIDDMEVLSFEIYDEKDNRIRVYIKDKKVFSFIYLAYEDI